MRTGESSGSNCSRQAGSFCRKALSREKLNWLISGRIKERTNPAKAFTIRILINIY